ncbi:hypothetical protein BC834DRAFT_463957 [Gloeopeniophorella convolvens]|nr:hypothetical protein BC834DRAFT_463957 [Gloeopeniophorella convolvens]
MRLAVRPQCARERKSKPRAAGPGRKVNIAKADCTRVCPHARATKRIRSNQERTSPTLPFFTIGKILDSVDQLLKVSTTLYAFAVTRQCGLASLYSQGLVFMHSKGVAHRDCVPKNILMDASTMYPPGFHPVRDLFLHDVTTIAPITPRSQVEVKCYSVDYGISSHSPLGSQNRLVLGTYGRDRGLPNCSTGYRMTRSRSTYTPSTTSCASCFAMYVLTCERSPQLARTLSTTLTPVSLPHS